MRAATESQKIESTQRRCIFSAETLSSPLPSPTRTLRNSDEWVSLEMVTAVWNSPFTITYRKKWHSSPSNKTKTPNHHFCYFFLCQNSFAVTPPTLPEPSTRRGVWHGEHTRRVLPSAGRHAEQLCRPQRQDGHRPWKPPASTWVWVCGCVQAWAHKNHKTRRPHQPQEENKTTGSYS